VRASRATRCYCFAPCDKPGGARLHQVARHVSASSRTAIGKTSEASMVGRPARRCLRQCSSSRCGAVGSVSHPPRLAVRRRSVPKTTRVTCSGMVHYLHVLNHTIWRSFKIRRRRAHSAPTNCRSRFEFALVGRFQFQTCLSPSPRPMESLGGSIANALVQDT
jgi:hypothetical protein